jgi:hypothetical protein
MKAWLVTWEWVGDHAKVRDPFIAILSSRKSDRRVAEFVEYYYLLMTSSAPEIASLANRPRDIPYKAETTVRINDVPHGEGSRVDTILSYTPGRSQTWSFLMFMSRALNPSNGRNHPSFNGKTVAACKLHAPRTVNTRNG